MVSRGSAPDPRDSLASAQTELGLPMGAVLADRYKVMKELGAGGMGRVYMAEDQKLGITVAVKVLRDILKQDPGSVKRLVSEAKASILLAHPNIVRLHNFEDGETTKFLVMEYVEGETLAHKIAREGRVSEDDARRISVEICKGLELAHSKKVIHRDMKPGNVLLGKDGSVKIADFGIARLCRDSVSRLTAMQDSGTLLYMAPEQLDGESGESSDLYSFGVTLYEMLAGDPPFLSGEITAQIRYKAPRDIEGLSPAMKQIVMKCLEKKPENRFASIRELREELDGTAEQRRMMQAQTGPQVQLLKANGQKAFDEGRFADALEFWEQALRMNPGDADLIASIQRARERQTAGGKADTPRPPAGMNEAEKRQRLESLKAKGAEAFAALRFGEAIACYREALALFPGDAALSQALAEAQRQADLVIKEAESRKSEESGKQWLDDITGRVNALFKKGALKEAENLLVQALQRLPDHAQLTEQLARVRDSLRPGGDSGGAGTQGRTDVKPPKSRRNLWIAAAVVILGLIIIGSIGQMGSSSPVAGTWNYTVAPTNVQGEITISGSDEQLQMSSFATYVAPGPDGMPHQVTEDYNWRGSLNGGTLYAECTGGTTTMLGYGSSPPQLPMTLNLQLVGDGSSMQGQVQSPLGWGTITASKR